MSQWLGHLVLHSFGLMVAGLLAVLVRTVFRRDPVSGYRFLVALLFAALFLPAAQFVVQGRAPEHAGFGEALLGRIWPRNPAPPIDVDLRSNDRAETASADDAARLEVEEIIELPDVEDEAEFRPRSVRSGVRGRPVHADSEPVLALTPPSSPAPKPAPSFDWSRIGGQEILAAIWLMGCLLLGAAHLRRMKATARLIARSTQDVHPEVRALFERLLAEHGLEGRVRLFASGEIGAPACCGALRPALLIPHRDGAAPPAPSLEWALRHEVEHIRRGDVRIALLQAAFTTVFWFHPIVWWISAQIDRLRELSCDLLVVLRTGKRKSYALALVDYARPRRAGESDGQPDADIHCPEGTPAALLHWFRSRSQLRRRIKMLEVTKSRPGVGRRLLQGATVLALSALLWSGQLALAATLLPAPQGGGGPANGTTPQEAPAGPQEAPAAPAPQAAPVAPELEILDEAEIESIEMEAEAAEAAETEASPFVDLEFDLVCKPKLGLKLARPSDEVAAALDIDPADCMVVLEVEKGSTAEAAGIRAGDVVVKIEGKGPANIDRLREAIEAKKDSGRIRLGIRREGRAMDLKVRVGREGEVAAAEAAPPAEPRRTAPRASGRTRQRNSDRNREQAREETRSRAVIEELTRDRAALNRHLDELDKKRGTLRDELMELRNRILENGEDDARERLEKAMGELEKADEAFARLREEFESRRGQIEQRMDEMVQREVEQRQALDKRRAEVDRALAQREAEAREQAQARDRQLSEALSRRERESVKMRQALEEQNRAALQELLKAQAELRRAADQQRQEIERESARRKAEHEARTRDEMKALEQRMQELRRAAESRKQDLEKQRIEELEQIRRQAEKQRSNQDEVRDRAKAEADRARAEVERAAQQLQRETERRMDAERREIELQRRDIEESSRRMAQKLEAETRALRSRQAEPRTAAPAHGRRLTTTEDCGDDCDEDDDGCCDDGCKCSPKPASGSCCPCPKPEPAPKAQPTPAGPRAPRKAPTPRRPARIARAADSGAPSIAVTSGSAPVVPGLPILVPTVPTVPTVPVVPSVRVATVDPVLPVAPVLPVLPVAPLAPIAASSAVAPLPAVAPVAPTTGSASAPTPTIAPSSPVLPLPASSPISPSIAIPPSRPTPAPTEKAEPKIAIGERPGEIIVAPLARTY